MPDVTSLTPLATIFKDEASTITAFAFTVPELATIYTFICVNSSKSAGVVY